MVMYFFLKEFSVTESRLEDESIEYLQKMMIIHKAVSDKQEKEAEKAQKKVKRANAHRRR